MTSAAVVPVQAALPPEMRHSTEYIDSLNKDISDAIVLLEQALKDDYDEALELTKMKIQENHWDYEYTMDSFYNPGNPYRDTNFQAIIAAYATIVRNGTRNRGMISDVPFLKVTFEEKNAPGGTDKYGEVHFEVMNAMDLFEYYGYSDDVSAVKTEYADRLQVINEATEEINLAQTMFIETPESVASEETDYTKYLQMMPKNLKAYNRNRYDIVVTALSLLGQVPYEWGGKPSHGGYDNTWWTFRDSGNQKGLDCSGFVQWVFMTLGYPEDVTGKVYYTGAIRDNLEKISYEELQPGDIGLKNEPEGGTNHTGIYLGNGLWIHCSSSGKTVVCNSGCFRYYRRAPIPEQFDTKITQGNAELLHLSGGAGGDYTEQDVMELAQLMEHEAGGEPYNGRIAVGEVVMNRVLDDEFPDTVHDVIFQTNYWNGKVVKQFENSQNIVNITPRAETLSAARQILEGKLRVFNNINVLYFRNSMRTSGVPASTPYNWGKLPWFTFIGHHAFYLGD